MLTPAPKIRTDALLLRLPRIKVTNQWCIKSKESWLEFSDANLAGRMNEGSAEICKAWSSLSYEGKDLNIIENSLFIYRFREFVFSQFCYSITQCRLAYTYSKKKFQNSFLIRCDLVAETLAWSALPSPKWHQHKHRLRVDRKMPDEAFGITEPLTIESCDFPSFQDCRS